MTSGAVRSHSAPNDLDTAILHNEEPVFPDPLLHGENANFHDTHTR
jgi:hypothetical protein